jgi:16S rRNA C967 or C1407 C5-methylase (RsmB/RsmF family)
MALIAIGFFLKGFFSGRSAHQNFSIDEIPLFNVYEHQPVKESKKAKRQKKQEKRMKSYLIPVMDENLRQECLDCLQSLGVKKQRERQEIVDKVFKEFHPTTIQEFISAYCKGQ